jgi:hypothetical protein
VGVVIVDGVPDRADEYAPLLVGSGETVLEIPDATDGSAGLASTTG